MMARCYNPKEMAKNPSYVGCSVVPEWHDFEVFADWFYEQDWEGNELDKDSKVKGNRIYGPDTCVLISKAENAHPDNTGMFSTNTSGHKGIGWFKPQEVWRVRVSQKHIGYFKNINDAIIARDEALQEQYK